MTEASLDFAELLDRARRGDAQAMTQLCQQYEPRLRVVARVLLGPALRPYLDSMDLVQSVHRSLLLGLRNDQFDISSPDKLIGLAVTLVRRKVARQWRRLQRQQRLISGSSSIDHLPRVLAELSAPPHDPAREAEFHDQMEHLFRQLDATERRIVELRLQDYSTAEIAGELGLHPVTLRVRMTRLRERLRAQGAINEWL